MIATYGLATCALSLRLMLLALVGLGLGLGLGLMGSMRVHYHCHLRFCLVRFSCRLLGSHIVPAVV